MLSDLQKESCFFLNRNINLGFKLTDQLDMNLENIRYYIAVTLLVLGCSGLPSALIVFSIRKIIHIDEKYLDAAYLAAYVIVVFFGLIFYIPRMRKLT